MTIPREMFMTVMARGMEESPSPLKKESSNGLGVSQGK